MKTNQFGQPVGDDIPHWALAGKPPKEPIEGRYCRIEPLDPAKHAAELYEAITHDKDGSSWTYMGAGPFASFEAYTAWMKVTCLTDDPLFHTIVDTQTNKAIGIASYLRIDPKMGVIEIGYIHYSPLLQRTRAATEAMYLFMRRVFDELHYRRYEWKCDAHNEPSRKAAVRYGFTYEGTFRQAMMYKGRNRDTAWYSIIDKEWPALKQRYERWLDPSNFDSEGKQLKTLLDC